MINILKKYLKENNIKNKQSSNEIDDELEQFISKRINSRDKINQNTLS